MTIEDGTSGKSFAPVAMLLAVVFPPAGFLFGVGLLRSGQRREGIAVMVLAVVVAVVLVVAFA